MTDISIIKLFKSLISISQLGVQTCPFENSSLPNCSWPPFQTVAKCKTTVAHKGHAANKKVAANKKKLLQIKKGCCK